MEPRGGALEVEVIPRSPFRLPQRSGGDRLIRIRQGVCCRLIHHRGRPVLVHVWQRRSGAVAFRATGPDAEAREWAIERMRFATGVDLDLTTFYREFRLDPFIGPAIRARPWIRPKLRPLPWEALAWAVTEQLIEAVRAAEIQRRIIARWGRRHVGMRDVPEPGAIAARAPAELAALDLAPKRAIALIRCAREIECGRVDPADPDGDRRLLAISEIGPWTVQCLGLMGRADFDSLPAGDLAYVKLIGHVLGRGMRATVPEIEDFYARYEPFRGLAGVFSLTHYYRATIGGPPLRLAA